MAVQLLSKAAYARHRKCDEKAVRKAIAEGRISTIDGKIDPEVADIQWAKNTRARADSRRTADLEGFGMGDAASEPVGPAKGSNANSPSQDPNYNDYRTRRERADSEMAERANLRDAGLVIDRDSTERAIFDAFRALRDAVMAVSPRSAPKCIGLSDVREIEHVITDEIRKAIEGWEIRMMERLPRKEPVSAL